MAEYAIRSLPVDFRRNEDSLAGELQELRKELGRSFLPEVDGSTGDSLLQHFTDVFFPDLAVSDYLVCRISQRERHRKSSSANPTWVDKIMVRPARLLARAETQIPAGLTPCVVGRMSRAPNRRSLIVDGIHLVGDCRSREFESEVRAVPIRDAGDPAAAQAFEYASVFEGEPLESTASISRTTHERLADWYDYLNWKERLLRGKMEGILYEHRSLKFDEEREQWCAVFLCAESAVDDNRRLKRLRRESRFLAFSVEDSEDVEEFRLKEDVKTQEKPRLGEILPRSASEGGNSARIELKLALDDRFADELADKDWEEQQEQIERFESQLPERGFLAPSAAGDFALLGRLRRNLNKLAEESGYAPFLSSYMFDVKKAGTMGPPTSGAESSLEWRNKGLNEDQRRAVAKMLEAPDICLIQGPPGTGKTTMIAEAVHQFALRGKRVLIASQANLAVDNVLEQLADDSVVHGVRLAPDDYFEERGKAVKEFAMDNGLGRFYRLAASAVDTDLLAHWDRQDRESSAIESFLEKCSFLLSDWAGEQERLTTLQAELDASEEELTALEEDAARRKRLRAEGESYLKAADFVEAVVNGDATEGHPEVPEDLGEAFRANIVVPISELADTGLGISPVWEKDWTALNTHQRAVNAERTMRSWQKALEVKGTLNAWCEQLRSAPGETWLSDEALLELEKLETREIQLRDEMESNADRLKDWQECRSHIKALTAQSQFFTRSKLEECFSSTGEPGASRIEFLLNQQTGTSQALHLLEEVVERVNAAENAVTRGIETLRDFLDSARAGVCLPEIDEERLRQQRESSRRLRVDMEDPKKSLQAIRKRYEAAQEPLRECRIDPAAYPIERAEELCQELRLHRESGSTEAEELRNDWEGILREWSNDLRDPSSVKRDAISFQETYVSGCNVVGMTCTHNPKNLQDIGHSYFDVVIIDEVSKATPPELVSSMMAGRKTILVGDHRQLPPVFSERDDRGYDDIRHEQEEAEEAGEASQPGSELTPENFKRFKKMVTASLFKEHFERADDTLKASLFLQFRMHSDIMRLVNSFYESHLQCGKPNLDEDKQHNLHIPARDGSDFIRPQVHALWMDSSVDHAGRPAFECQAGTGKVNCVEVASIASLLEQLDAACHAQGFGENGTPKKPVGVISFYGQQVRAIRTWCGERTKAKPWTGIDVEMNTVDQFQGKEKPIILVSMVRSVRPGKRSSSAHVAQFERINVALSRAQELLVIFGASSMFEKYEVELPFLDREGSAKKRVYKQILDELRRNNALFEPAAIVDNDRYNEIKALVDKQAGTSARRAGKGGQRR